MYNVSVVIMSYPFETTAMTHSNLLNSVFRTTAYALLFMTLGYKSVQILNIWTFNSSSYHNYLRITRILKSLGEFDFEHLKAGFVRFVLSEGMVKGTLDKLIDSCVKYWIGVLRNDEEREAVENYYKELLKEKNTE